MNTYNETKRSRRKPSRSESVTQEVPQRRTREKYAEEREERLREFTPTDSQKVFINKIRENILTIVDAHAGVGKTAACLHYFAKEYVNNPSLSIFVIRTPVELGDDKVGFLPNDLSQKVEPHFASAKVLLEQFLGKNKVENDIGKRIHFKIPNFTLGCTLDNALVLIDEGQMISSGVMKLLLERAGKNTKYVVAGCTQQMYASDKKRNGLSDLIARFFYEKEIDGEVVDVPKYDEVALHRFTIDDIQRSDFVKTVVRAYS